MRILVTGFEPFGGHAINPSGLVLDALTRPCRLLTRVLPVVYLEAGAIVRELILTERPDAVICLGLCTRSPHIRLERIAVNLNDSAPSDNAGDRAAGRVIDPDGPVGYWSTLPLEAMYAALHAGGVPVTFSSHAGTFVCNHVFYTARRTIEQLGRDTPCGFVHVPALDGDGLSLPSLVNAIHICLRVIESSASKQ